MTNLIDNFQFVPYKKRKFDAQDDGHSSSSSLSSSSFSSHHSTVEKSSFDSNIPVEFERQKKSKHLILSGWIDF
jgi:hypothetical protein